MNSAAKRSSVPSPTPRRRCLNTTEEMFEAPRASGPKTAERNTRMPSPTKRAIMMISVLSTRILRFVIALDRGKRQDDSRNREHNRKHPVAHHYFVWRPADGLKVMV